MWIVWELEFHEMVWSSWSGKTWKIQEGWLFLDGQGKGGSPIFMLLHILAHRVFITPSVREMLLSAFNG